LRVERRVARRALVDRRVPVRLERVGVVTGRQVQVALRVEHDVAADVAADAAVHRHVDDLLFGVELDLPVGEAEARQPDHALERLKVLRSAVLRRVALVDLRPPGVVLRCVLRWRVVDVDPVVPSTLAEARVDRDALQALLVVLVHVDGRGDAVDARLGVVVPYLAPAGRVQHTAVRQDGEVHGFTRFVVQRDLLEVGVGRRGTLAHRRQRGQSAQRQDEGSHDGCSCAEAPPRVSRN
jgi:hypothetical protein